MKQKTNLRVRAVGMCLCAQLLWLASCGGSDQSQATNQQHPAYETMIAGADSRMLSQAYSATVRGRQDVAIMPQVGGTLTKVCCTEGEHVAAGQVLFVIDQVPFLAAVRTAEANVEAARAALATAQLNYESNQELQRQNVVSEFTLKTAENAYLTAKASLSQAQAALTNARNSLSYTEVKAPAAGVVGQLPYRVGALVSPQMQEPLTTVSDNSEMWVYFSLTETQLLALSREYGSLQEAADSLPAVRLQLKDATMYDQEGRIASIAGVVDQRTGTVTCRAVFANPQGVLHSGQSGNVLVPVSYDNVVVIPQSAAVRQQDKYLVYKVVDGKAVGQLVSVESVSDGREFIVTEGLNVGDEIVAKGAGLLREGMQVK